MESRSRPFDFDIRYKTGGVTRHRQQRDKEQLREKAERAQWNRGADYLILISATRQGKLRDIVNNKARSSYERRRSELNGIGDIVRRRSELNGIEAQTEFNGTEEQII